MRHLLLQCLHTVCRLARVAGRPAKLTATAAVVLLLVGAFAGWRAEAADTPLGSELFNWYYASAFGTGAYRVGDQTVTVLSAPITYTLRPLTEEQSGIRLTFPITAALANFHYQDLEFSDTRIAGMSVLPGAEMLIAIDPHWMVRPFVGLGYGTEFHAETGATIYQLGVTTAYNVPGQTFPRISLGARLVYAGYVSNDGGGLPLSGLSIGASSAFPLERSWDGRRLSLGLQLIGTGYFDDLEFLVPGSGIREIRSEYEIGVSLNLDPPVLVFGAPFDRLGLGFLRGGGGLQGIRLITEFPF